MNQIINPVSIELFSGAGGLALGLEDAGFLHTALVEWDADACKTMRINKGGGTIFSSTTHNWNIFETDVTKFDYAPFVGNIDFVAGGPPCQPFSLGGKHQAFLDKRDMFPEAVRSIRELKPKAFLFENVKGLTRPSFSKYFEYILLQLTYPDVVQKKNEEWLKHLSRLERYHTKKKVVGLSYKLVFRVINAADYGVPQRRERVIIVGFRNDIDIEWSFPLPTHSYASLVASQRSQEYWERHCIPKRLRHSPALKDGSDEYGYDGKKEAERLLPWLTVRDAIGDLPDPQKSKKKSDSFLNHFYMPGAKVYAGHTGSHIDLPSKTIKAGNHGVPGGENMILFPSGDVRYFTVREAARLQTFPDSYMIDGSWSESMRQLGNAVPVRLARTIGQSIKEKLLAYV